MNKTKMISVLPALLAVLFIHVGIGFGASIEDTDQDVRHGFEGVVNPEEHGYYLMGVTEKRISDLVKVRTQMDFFYDGQKYISDEYDSVRIAGHFTFSF